MSRNISFTYLTYNSPSLYRFTDFSTGSSNTQIIGHVTSMKDLNIRFTLTHYASGPAVQYVRIIIFRHKPTDSALSVSGAGTILLDDPGTA